MQASEDMKFHSISAPLDKKASTTDGTLVVQFTVKHEKKDYAFCGGGYIKLLPGKVDGKQFGGDTPYSIMFGPDLCGYDVSRIHLIFEHNGENLLKTDEIKLDYADKDEFTHLYTLVLEKDGSYEVFLDQDSKAQGNIVDGWDFPDKEIKDPEVSKPEDWVDTKKIPDPEAVKPDGYDDIPAEIPDPEAEQPEDWDAEEDGEWEPCVAASLLILLPRAPNAVFLESEAPRSRRWRPGDITASPRRRRRAGADGAASPSSSAPDAVVSRRWRRETPTITQAYDRQPRLQGRVEGADDRQPRLQGPLGAPADPEQGLRARDLREIQGPHDRRLRALDGERRLDLRQHPRDRR